MQTIVSFATFFCLLHLTACMSVRGQGSYLVDQQAGLETGSWSPLQSNQPIGQSFTPSLAGIGFVKFWLADLNLNGQATTLVVRLHTFPIFGPAFAESVPATLGDGAFEPVTFTFASEVALTPGTLYFMQPWVTAGDSPVIVGYNYGYEGGTAYGKGVSQAALDLWFREGIIVPEPGTGAVLGLGLGLLAWVRRPRSS